MFFHIILFEVEREVVAGHPVAVGHLVAVGHPVAVAAVITRILAKPALLAVGRIVRDDYFFLKNPNFGFGLGWAPPPASAAAAVHSCIFATSHVI